MDAIKERAKLGDMWREANKFAATCSRIISNGNRYADSYRGARGGTMDEISQINASIAALDAANVDNEEYRKAVFPTQAELWAIRPIRR